MATTSTVPEARIRKRRIVERPRLYALLDASPARVRTLVAPAGYGKTTLAEQWVARDGRTATWYTARSASTDVAALALGLARSATAIVEGCDHRLREHMRALPAPAENVETLAEILGEDLAEWPESAWLVLDDYHEVAQEPHAEDFVAALVAESPVRFLIASRVRPSWVSTKDLMYGKILELSQTVLAMDDREAADVLVDRSARSASGLVSLANGWPAVIGLASVSSAEIDADAEPVPESLYRYLADEVFGALGPEVQQGLTTLAVAPVLDRELVVELLGADAEAVAACALDVGILVERGTQIDLHPLARAFLAERVGQLGLVPADASGATCLAHYREHRDWDAAFDLIARFGWAGELKTLLADALDDLLEAARLSTLERWCDFAFDVEVASPLFSIASAEVLLRQGRHSEAMVYGEAAAEGERIDKHDAYRGLSLAGRAAHLASLEHEASELYRRAYEVADSDQDRQDALWGKLGCLIELERPESAETLRKLASNVRRADPRDMVRAAAYGLSLQTKLGNLDLAEADVAATLLGRVRDPLLVSSFESIYSIALGLAARYSEARDVAERFGQTVQRYRLDFAVAYSSASLAQALAGLREWTEANASALSALKTAMRNRDGHAQQLFVALLIRILSQQGRHQDALDLELPVLGAPLPAAQAELMSSRALALASSGRVQEARQSIHSVRALSGAIEPNVLFKAVDAITALKEHDADLIQRVADLEDTAFARGGPDLLVGAYRSAPELLSVLTRQTRRPDRLLGLIRRAHDDDLTTLVGQPTFAGGDPKDRLSRREREVYELLIQRLTNREIARLLFIEESTVKVHVHHIYDKLGVRSRVALTVQAQLERASGDLSDRRDR
jgi:ATP/maltotriose-dependent transcriptional regulator MalT